MIGRSTPRMTKGPNIEWDHQWMEENWRDHDDDEIAQRFNVARNTVKRYRQRRQWKRERQRYQGGTSGAKIAMRVMLAIQSAIKGGKEVHISTWAIGSAHHMVVSMSHVGDPHRTHPVILPGLLCLPRILQELSSELSSELDAKRK